MSTNFHLAITICMEIVSDLSTFSQSICTYLDLTYFAMAMKIWPEAKPSPRLDIYIVRTYGIYRPSYPYAHVYSRWPPTPRPW